MTADTEQRVGLAIENARVDYSLRLIRLMDGVETWLLKINDGSPALECSSHEEGMKRVRKANRASQARAAIATMEADRASEAELVAALRELVRVRDWVVAAGGESGPLSADVIRQFAIIQIPAIDTARSLIAKHSSKES